MIYRGFSIVDKYGSYYIWGTDRDTMKYGFIRAVESISEAQNLIDEILGD